MTLNPEIEEGNIEYKRYLINLDINRLEQLSTQMKWRLAEGDNEAIYYLGVDDNGLPFKLSEEQKKETLNNFTLLLNKNNANIVNFEVIKSIDKTSYFKITIRTKTIIYPEIRIILLGDSLCGKTTFLSNILLNKIDSIQSESRLYLMNHKHELETKKTSSINCYYKIWDKIKYTFIEAPGDDEYIRTKYKILLGTHPNICLIFSNSNNKYNNKYSNIINNLNIPSILINTFDETSDFNCKKLINKSKLFDLIQKNMKIPIEINRNKIIFNILSVYPHSDLGIIVSGFLLCGKIEINKNINWYDKNGSRSTKCKINSIHISSEPIKETDKQSMLTICLRPIKLNCKLNYKLKYGILSNKLIKQVNKINFDYIKIVDNKKELPSNIFGYCENKLVYINNIIKKYNEYEAVISNYYEAVISNYYEGDGPIIIDNEFNNGIIIIKLGY
jgi:GTPase